MIISKKIYNETLNEISRLNKEIADAKQTMAELQSKNSSLESKNREQDISVRQASSTLQNCLEALKQQQQLLSYMYQAEIAENSMIEFAGIKTVRDGWVSLNLRGEEIQVPKGADVTIWASHDEAVRIDVDHN